MTTPGGLWVTARVKPPGVMNMLRIPPEQWLLHLEAAEQASHPLSAYALDNDLNVQHL